MMMIVAVAPATVYTHVQLPMQGVQQQPQEAMRQPRRPPGRNARAISLCNEIMIGDHVSSKNGERGDACSSAVPKKMPNVVSQSLDVPSAGPQEGSLAALLEEIRDVPASRVIVLRKIQPMGFQAEDLLHEHFSALGRVDRVLVVHSRVLTKDGKRVRRVRPASLGLVVMADECVVEAIHAAGSERVVSGKRIIVDRFARCDNGSDSASTACSSGKSDCGSVADDSTLGEASGVDCETSSQGSWDLGSFDCCPTDDEDWDSSNFEYYATDDEFF